MNDRADAISPYEECLIARQRPYVKIHVPLSLSLALGEIVVDWKLTILFPQAMQLLEYSGTDQCESRTAVAL